MHDTVLFIDDEPDILSIVKKGLEHYGYTVDAVSDPELAARGYQVGRYDILLIDYKMPKMSGADFFQKIRSIDDKVKICFLTAWEIELDEKLMKLVKDGHSTIRKPVSIKRLENQLTDLMKHS